MKIVKSIGAIVAGIVFVIITHTGTDLIFESLGIFPSDNLRVPWMAATALSYRIVFQIAGGYLTAMLAPSRPMLHALIFGTIGLALGTAGAAVALPLDLSPAWYPVGLAVSALPSGWLGGRIYTKMKEANLHR